MTDEPRESVAIAEEQAAAEALQYEAEPTGADEGTPRDARRRRASRYATLRRHIPECRRRQALAKTPQISSSPLLAEAAPLRFGEVPRTEVRFSGASNYGCSAVSRRRNLPPIGCRKTSSITTCIFLTSRSETAMDCRILIVTSPEPTAARSSLSAVAGHAIRRCSRRSRQRSRGYYRIRAELEVLPTAVCRAASPPE
jgi:hypothetical protein